MKSADDKKSINFKFAPIRKRFRYLESVSLCEQKCPPHHLSNPQGYRDTTNEVKSADDNKSINFKFAPIRKRFRYSESVSLCEQKCPPHHSSYPQGYQDTII